MKNTEKQKYEEAILSVIYLQKVDILTTSGEEEEPDWGFDGEEEDSW